MPRYLLLLTENDHYERWSDADDEQRDQAFASFNRFLTAARETGSIVAGQALLDLTHAATLTAGTEEAPDPGPFAATDQQVCGFYVVDQPDRDGAVRLARLLPDGYRIEIRECEDVQVL